MSELYGISRQEEEATLKSILQIAEDKLEGHKADVKRLADELHEMQEEFDEGDKETQALWHNADARFQEVNRNLKQAMQARKKPYFGRIDFTDRAIGKEECYYIGRSVIAKDPAHPEVIDWRAPVAGIYYDAALGETSYSVKGEGRFRVRLTRKRTYEIENDTLKDFYDSDVVANDDLLTKYLAKNKKAVLGEIIATIQKEQNQAIRRKPQHNMIIQGAAGSGKTTVAMHRISYILYNYEREFAPEDFYVIGSNQVLLNYITGVLPELNVYGVSQMTMEQLFVRLLYEDWDKKYKVKPVTVGVTEKIKGEKKWFEALEAFCDAYEEGIIPKADVVIEKTGAVLLTAEEIQRIKQKGKGLSRADKITMLTEHLTAKLENEISGKYYSYTAEEKKKLTKYYDTYFGKREWKGSIFDLYEAFLTEQREQGNVVEFPEGTFDLYDLAALAYLYKRLKETEIIREAGHVVIDEAQDFGMMAYCVLKHCLSKCTFTIMGDVAQNISMDYGLNDWSELRTLMLPDDFDTFGLLQKSYRNTVEISHFATDILHHGSFEVYPVQPIVRHGNAVEVKKCKDFKESISNTVDIVKKWQSDGKETIAIICNDEEESLKVVQALEGKIEVTGGNLDAMEFNNGVMVLPLAYTKGLEFDAVLIFDANNQSYPCTDGYAKRLYVAATRALHELTVLYTGTLTDLIAKPVTEDRKREAVVNVEPPKMPFQMGEPELTNAELAVRTAKEGHVEMAEREKYGPKRIAAIPKAQTTANTRVKISNTTATVPSYLERRREELSSAGKSVNKFGEFGEMPDNNILRPAGHSRIDCSVRMCMKSNAAIDILSSYGTLHIVPLAPNLIRVCFARGQKSNFPAPIAGFKEGSVRFKVRETRDAIEILTEKLLLQVSRKTGAVSYSTAQGKFLLKERDKEPRQITEDRSYVFFDWDKNENLIAKGESGGANMKIATSAKYISYGRISPEFPALMGAKGYQIILPPQLKVLCCNISMYGTYLCTEGSDIVDYYVKL